MAYGWRAQLVLTAMAALTVGSAFAYVQRAHLYEVLDTRPLPPLQTIDYHSDALDQTYRLFVQLPPGYDSSRKCYPVMFALDGGAAVELYTEHVLPHMRRREIQEAIFVGIGYGSDRSEFTRAGFFDNRRIRDFTFGYNELTQTAGKADIFLAFLADKVVPFIDATYRTDPAYRSIGGYGLGARYAAYASIARPDAFQGCLAIEPGHVFDPAAKPVVDSIANPDASRFCFTTTTEPGSPAALAAFDAADALRAQGYTNVLVMDAEAIVSQRNNALAVSVVEGLRYLFGT